MISLLVSWVCRPMVQPGARKPLAILMFSSTCIRDTTWPSPPRIFGHTLVPFEGEADVYVINSCTVTAVSDKKSRQTVRQARKRALINICVSSLEF